MSILPFSATIFLMNQELQIVYTDFHLSNFYVSAFGSEWQLSMRQLLIALAIITGVAWGLGLYMAIVVGRVGRQDVARPKS